LACLGAGLPALLALIDSVALLVFGLLTPSALLGTCRLPAWRVISIHKDDLQNYHSFSDFAK